MDKEEFDKRWNTCRYCGITTEDIEKDKQFGNWVIDGECRICRDKKEKESDFEEAKREGSITRDDSIMCPYCGYVDDEIEGEQHNCSTFDCPECEKESNLEVEYTSHFTTTKK